MPFPFQNTNSTLHSNSTDVTLPAIQDTFLLLIDQASDQIEMDLMCMHLPI